MESILALFVNHDTYVVSFLVLAIATVVVLLLLFSHKSPENVVKTELGDTENVEGALRRVLGEQRWLQTGESSSVGAEGGGDPQKVSALENEVLEKDRKIAELNKQLTHSSGGGGGDDSELLARINELEGRLQEYEIIEDDIADLSLYKTENEKLKEELDRLKAQLGGGAPAQPVVEESSEEPIVEPAPEPEAVAEPEPEPEAPTPTPASEEEEDEGGVDGADLVAEFEKVVNSQIEMAEAEEASATAVSQDDSEEGTGSVVMADSPKIETEPPPTHPKLQNVNPDSKEEAQVFISELKSLKTKKEG